jgi:hypothetical protein
MACHFHRNPKARCQGTIRHWRYYHNFGISFYNFPFKDKVIQWMCNSLLTHEIRHFRTLANYIFAENKEKYYCAHYFWLKFSFSSKIYNYSHCRSHCIGMFRRIALEFSGKRNFPANGVWYKFRAGLTARDRWRAVEGPLRPMPGAGDGGDILAT